MSKGVISTHVYMMPFAWELKNRHGRGTLKQHKQMDHPSLSGLESWKIRTFYMEDESTYNEYVYFYKPAIQMLYQIGNQKLVRIYEKMGLDEKSTLTLTVEQKEYVLKLKNIELRLYKSGIGILTLHCENHEVKAPEGIMAINSMSKSVYPYLLPLQAAHKDLFPEKIVVRLNDREKIIETFSEDYKEKPLCMTSMMRQLFGDNFVFEYKFLKQDKIFVEPLLGNRMFVLCVYNNAEFLKQIKNQEISKRFLNSFILFSRREKLREGESYLDLPKVVYGMSRFSLVCITSSAKETKLYNHIVLLALAQKASLLHFGNQIARIAELPKVQLVQAIEDLYEVYIQFISQMHFNEVTVDVQGSYIYNELLRQLMIEKEIKELDFEMQEMHEYAALIDQAQSKGKMDFLTIIGTALVIPTFVTGFFGMNILEEKFMDWWKHKEIILWFNSYALLPVTVVLLVYSMWNRKSRKSRVIQNILLVISLISIYILIKWGCGLD
ncbi:magnesium transporter CorA family protein [Niameybacter massiliensis]|uniref:CorA family divalent cation transporter n=1 Tax=Niameybacter massiliensis TaxID=1658108 RepID=UPI0006B52729|nr:CorA family divalent cation transporter [Niameybacter massiliensis]